MDLSFIVARDHGGNIAEGSGKEVARARELRRMPDVLPHFSEDPLVLGGEDLAPRIPSAWQCAAAIEFAGIDPRQVRIAHRERPPKDFRHETAQGPSAIKG
jgi:hypothetical protein